MQRKLKQIREDLLSSRIVKLIGSNVFLLHKPEEIESNLYIEYEIISDKEIFHAGNRPLIDGDLIQVDIFSKGDFSELADLVQETLEQNDYQYVDGITLYEEDTKLFHWASRYYKTF